jgi:glyoxylate carboligase
MGFGLPAAVGAKVAAPNKMVIDIDGDASFSMTAMELATASQFDIGVKVMVMNNEFQGMVLQWQGMDHCWCSQVYVNWVAGRSILRSSVFAHAHDKPGLRPTCEGYGSPCDSCEQFKRATREDEGVPRVRREPARTVRMHRRGKRARFPDGASFWLNFTIHQ